MTLTTIIVFLRALELDDVTTSDPDRFVACSEVQSILSGLCRGVRLLDMLTLEQASKKASYLYLSQCQPYRRQWRQVAAGLIFSRHNFPVG
jgi:hypothetical protein